jgi:N6-L-threonylcarbamoyladenine synthase
MLLLAIETSCDETAAAVIDRQLVIRSNIVSSQVELHAEFGGVVPEIASRAHLTNILPVLDQALSQAGVSLDEITAVAVVTEPGLVGSLLVGLSAAKAICLARDLPLVPVHHIEAHLFACRMSSPRDVYPAVGLVVSGGHTSLYECRGPLESTLIGSTIDDAAGEAFDKVARTSNAPQRTETPLPSNCPGRCCPNPDSTSASAGSRPPSATRSTECPGPTGCRRR